MDVTNLFLKNVLHTLSFRYIGIALNLLSTIVITRELGPEGKGLFAIVLLYGALGVQISNFGLHAANVFFAAQDRKHVSGLVWNSLFTSIVIGFLLIFFVIVAQDSIFLIQSFFLECLLLATWIPLTLLYLLLQHILLGTQEVRVYNRIDIIVKVFFFLVIFLVIFQWKTVLAFLLIHVASMILGVGLILFHLREYVKLCTLSLRFFIHNFSYGIKGYIASLIAFIGIRADLFFVQHVFSTKEVGYYAASLGVIDMLYLIPSTIGMVLFSTLVNHQDHNIRWTMTRRILTRVIIGMSILALIVSFLAHPLVSLLYGEAFIPSTALMMPLLVLLVVRSIDSIVMNYFASTGMPPIIIVAPVLGLIITTASFFLFGYQASLDSIPFFITASFSIMIIVELVYFYKKRSVYA